MADWVWSDYWGAYVADCGPYLGDWPPYPPLPSVYATEPDTSEIDYFVAMPNPLGDVSAVADDSYDTTYIDIWRYDATGSSWNAFFGTSGASVADFSAAPPGAHLFVFWYEGSSSTPAHDALELAPPNMVSGGTAPQGGFATGATWSDYFDEAAHADVASNTATMRVNRQNSAMDDSYYPSWLADSVGKANEFIQAAIAGHNVDTCLYQHDYLNVFPNRPFAEGRVYADKEQGDFTGSLPEYTRIQGWMQNWGASYNYDPSALNFLRPEGTDDLVPGLDFALTVDMIASGQWWDRNSAVDPTWVWNEATGTLQGASWYEVIVHGLATSEVAVPMDIQLAVGPDLSEATIITWSTDPVWSDSFPGHVIAFSGDTLAVPVSASLSGQPTGELFFLLQVDVLNGRTIVMPEPATPVAQSTNNSVDANFSFNFSAFSVGVLVTPSPYRYLAPTVTEVSPTALRLNQRDDSLGITPTPRRIGGISQPRSEQGATVRRIGGANTFR